MFSREPPCGQLFLVPIIVSPELTLLLEGEQPNVSKLLPQDVDHAETSGSVDEVKHRVADIVSLSYVNKVCETDEAKEATVQEELVEVGGAVHDKRVTRLEATIVDSQHQIHDQVNLDLLGRVIHQAVEHGSKHDPPKDEEAKEQSLHLASSPNTIN